MVLKHLWDCQSMVSCREVPEFLKITILSISTWFWRALSSKLHKIRCKEYFGSITAILLHLYPQFLTICNQILQNSKISHFRKHNLTIPLDPATNELSQVNLGLRTAKDAMWLTLNSPCVFIFYKSHFIPYLITFNQRN